MEGKVKETSISLIKELRKTRNVEKVGEELITVRILAHLLRLGQLDIRQSPRI